MDIYCCSCRKEVTARLTSGEEVYSHRPDLASLPFWICDKCKNFVGCHYKTKNKTQPLGVIATNEIKRIRMQIHSVIDPLWSKGRISRKSLYEKIGKRIGQEYHTASIRSKDEAVNILNIVIEIRDSLLVRPEDK